MNLNQKIRDLKPYDPIQGTYQIRLDANESYFNLPEILLERDRRTNPLQQPLTGIRTQWPREVCARPLPILLWGESRTWLPQGTARTKALSVIMHFFFDARG